MTAALLRLPHPHRDLWGREKEDFTRRELEKKILSLLQHKSPSEILKLEFNRGDNICLYSQVCRAHFCSQCRTHCSGCEFSDLQLSLQVLWVFPPSGLCTQVTQKFLLLSHAPQTGQPARASAVIQHHNPASLLVLLVVLAMNLIFLGLLGATPSCSHLILSCSPSSSSSSLPAPAV